MLASLIVANLAGARVHLCWETNDDCGARFDELFETQDIEPITLISGFNTSARWYDALKLGGKEVLRLLSISRVIYIIVSNPFAEDLYDGEVYRKNECELMRRLLRPSKQIRSVIQSFPPFRAAIHVRGTDHFPSLVATPLAAYAALLRQLGEDIPADQIIICSDSSYSLASLRRISGISFRSLDLPANRTDTCRTTEAVKRALAELYIIGSCRFVFGSGSSSFCRVASLVGECQLIYVSIGWSAHPKSATGRVIASICWKIYRWVYYDRSSQEWKIWPKRRSGYAMLSSRLALCIVRIFASDLYQLSAGNLLAKISLSTAAHNGGRMKHYK